MKILRMSLIIVSFAMNAFSQSTPSPAPPSRSEKPAAPVTPDEREEIIKIDSTLVTIPVSVIGTDGKYLLDLKQQDFRLFEEGSEQEITNFAALAIPVHIVLMIDTSRSTKFKIEDIQRAAQTFIEQLQPHDQVMVVSFDEKIRVQCEFTTDRKTIQQAISKTKTGLGTKLYDALNFVMTQQPKQQRGRKAIVLFTDGVDTESKYGAGKQSMFGTEQAEIIIYPIQYDTVADVNQMMNGRQRTLASEPTAEEYELGTRYLHALAQRSGGRLQHAETLNNVHEAFALIAEELRHQYVLSYYPRQEANQGEYRRVKIEVKKPAQSIRARTGYRVGS